MGTPASPEVAGAGSGPVARHRTAITRTDLSRPMRLAIEAGLLPEGSSVLDYGCGRGGDVEWLTRAGYDAIGWDPVHRPEGKRRKSDVVNIGYVINVIEDATERQAALRKAWQLAKNTLVVSALVTVDVNTKATPYGDGILTSRGTFQRHYDQQELENYIRDALGSEPVALGLVKSWSCWKFEGRSHPRSCLVTA